LKFLEARTGIEPVYTDLQSARKLNDFNGYSDKKTEIGLLYPNVFAKVSE